jgi:hypothetical protein
MMEIEKMDINAVCFGILCNFAPVCGEERAKEAVRLVRSLQAENEKLQAELKKEVAARKKQADILCELRGQKYEQNYAIDQLRAGLKQAKREKGAAIRDLEEIMQIGGGNMDTCQFCKNGQCYGRGGRQSCTPEWRGPEEE